MTANLAPTPAAPPPVVGKSRYWLVSKKVTAIAAAAVMAAAGVFLALMFTIGPWAPTTNPLIGTWTGHDSSGWSGTMVINSNHTFSFNGTVNGRSGSVSGTWAQVSGNEVLTVEPSNNDMGAVVHYTISNDGHTLTYTDSTAPGVVTTLTK